MKNTLIYILLAACGGLLLANTRTLDQKPEYDYLFIEQYNASWRFYENERFLYSVITDRHFRKKYGFRDYIMIQIDSLSNENWEVMQLQSNYNSEYDRYLYSAILKREKGKE